MNGDRPLVLDGAMGTEALARGLAKERNIDALNLTAPDVVAAIHRAYIAAGADIITTNTFGSNRLTQSRYGRVSDVTSLNRAAVRIARDEAATNSRNVFVAGSIGPIVGAAQADITDAIAEQADVLVQSGVDLLLVETVLAVDVLDATLRGIDRVRRTATTAPIVISMCIDPRTGCLYDGHEPTAVSEVVSAYNPVAVGFNCGADPEELLATALRYSDTIPYPLIVYPGAGLPDAAGRYPVTPARFAASFARLLSACRPAIVGGCCGTTPAHIAALAARL